MISVNAHILADVMAAWMMFILVIFFGFLSHAYHRDAMKHIYTWKQARRFSIWFFVLALECAYICVHFVRLIWGNG